MCYQQCHGKEFVIWGQLNEMRGRAHYSTLSPVTHAVSNATLVDITACDSPCCAAVKLFPAHSRRSYQEGGSWTRRKQRHDTIVLSNPL